MGEEGDRMDACVEGDTFGVLFEGCFGLADWEERIAPKAALRARIGDL
jgi:hypothetical protein